MGGVVLQNSDRSPTLPHSLTKQTLTPCLVLVVPSRSTLDSVMLMLMPDCVASSVLSSPRHILLIGFFGDFFWRRNPVLKDVCH